MPFTVSMFKTNCFITLFSKGDQYFTHIAIFLDKHKNKLHQRHQMVTHNIPSSIHYSAGHLFNMQQIFLV